MLQFVAYVSLRFKALKCTVVVVKRQNKHTLCSFVKSKITLSKLPNGIYGPGAVQYDASRIFYFYFLKDDASSIFFFLCDSSIC